VKYVGEYLLPTVFQREANVSARAPEQRGNRRRDRNMVTRAVKRLEKTEGFDNGGQVSRNVFGNSEGVKAAETLPAFEKLLVPKGE
jgi:hypothetical protein